MQPGRPHDSISSRGFARFANQITPTAIVDCQPQQHVGALAAPVGQPRGTNLAGQRHAIWVVEGLAMLYQSSRMDGEGLKITIGADLAGILYVLDEPTVSLDVDAVAMFARAVRAHLGGGGMALLARPEPDAASEA